MIKRCTPFLLFMIFTFHCQPEKRSGQEAFSSGGLFFQNGGKLAKVHCAGCHQYPDPGLLDRKSWEDYVLPRMAYLMGIDARDQNAEVFVEAGLTRHPSVLQPGEWEAIKNFYLKNAPEQLPRPPSPAVNKTCSLFKAVWPELRLSPPSTTLVRFLEEDGCLIGDANTQRLYLFDRDLQLRGAANVREGLVSVEEVMDSYLLTVMGSFSPTDEASGFVMTLPKLPQVQPRVIIDQLQRPAHTALADLDGDGFTDLVISEFAKWEGCLAWWRNHGDGIFTKNILRKQPGAIRSVIQDLNGDRLLDIATLFGQGDEGIFIYLNKGDGRFKEMNALHFPPSYGSSYFDLFDYDLDDHPDIIYTAGDNADFMPVLKPYHGIYIYKNDGKNRFSQTFFYPLNGAYKAVPRDFDHDGDLDMAAISFFPDFQKSPEEGFVFLENQGNDRFVPYTFPEVNLGRWIVMDVGDPDLDGDLDLLLGSLSFEIIPPSPLLNVWVEKGAPFVMLENLRF